MQTLTIGTTTLAARITQTGFPSFSGVSAPSATHSASLELNNLIRVGSEVVDQDGRKYRVITVREILGKQRLQMSLR